MSAGLIPVELPWGNTEILKGTTVDELFDANTRKLGA